MAPSHTLSFWEMPKQKSRPMTLRLPEQADEALDAVARELGLDRSSTLRFLVLEKVRAMNLPLPSRPALAAPAPPVAPEPRRAPRGARRVGKR